MTVPAVAAVPKDPDDFTVVGRPTTRIDARDIVTGRARYTQDLAVPGALPCVVARPADARRHRADRRRRRRSGDAGGRGRHPHPHRRRRRGPRRSTRRWPPAMPWRSPGPRGRWRRCPTPEVRARLQAATPPFVLPPLGSLTVDPHLRLRVRAPRPAGGPQLRGRRAGRPGRAVAVGPRARSSPPRPSPSRLGLPVDRVTVHVVRGGGSFGRRLFFDPAIEAGAGVEGGGPTGAAAVDPGRRHAPRPPASRQPPPGPRHARCSARWSATSTGWARCETRRSGHGLGELLTAPWAPRRSGTVGPRRLFLTSASTTSTTSASRPALLTRGRPRRSPPGAGGRCSRARSAPSTRSWSTRWRAARASDPVAFRRAGPLKPARQRAVLDQVAAAGTWGRAMAPGTAQGVGLHEEYKSADRLPRRARRPRPPQPRVTRAVAAVDVGRAVNPRGPRGPGAGRPRRRPVGDPAAPGSTSTAGLSAGEQLHRLPLRPHAARPARGRGPRHARRPANPAAPASWACRPPSAPVANAWARATGSPAPPLPDRRLSAEPSQEDRPCPPTPSTSTARPSPSTPPADAAAAVGAARRARASPAPSTAAASASAAPAPATSTATPSSPA